LLQGPLRDLEEVRVYAQLPYFRFECLSGNAQLDGGAGWTPNHAFGFPQSGLEYFSFVLDKVGRTVVQWDKDDCSDMKIIKVDLLGLGMLPYRRQATFSTRLDIFYPQNLRLFSPKAIFHTHPC
jgi:hypothetical protein